MFMVSPAEPIEPNSNDAAHAARHKPIVPSQSEALNDLQFPAPPRSHAVVICREVILTARDTQREKDDTRKKSIALAQEFLPVLERISTGTLTHFEAGKLLVAHATEKKAKPDDIIVEMAKLEVPSNIHAHVVRVRLILEPLFSRLVYANILEKSVKKDPDIPLGLSTLPHLSVEEFVPFLKNAALQGAYPRFGSDEWKKESIDKLLAVVPHDLLREAVELLQMEAILSIQPALGLDKFDEIWSPALPWIYLSPHAKKDYSAQLAENYKGGGIIHTRRQTFLAASATKTDISKLLLDEFRDPLTTYHLSTQGEFIFLLERRVQALKQFAQLYKEIAIDLMTSEIGSKPSENQVFAAYSTWLLCQPSLYGERGSRIVHDTINKQLEQSLPSPALTALFFFAPHHPTIAAELLRVLDTHPLTPAKFMASIPYDTFILPKGDVKPTLGYDSPITETSQFSRAGLFINTDALKWSLSIWGTHTQVDKNILVILECLSKEASKALTSSLTKIMRSNHRAKAAILAISGLPSSELDAL